MGEKVIFFVSTISAPEHPNFKPPSPHNALHSFVHPGPYKAYVFKVEALSECATLDIQSATLNR